MSMLNIGTTALLGSQGSLSTTSHNISNVNTEGYSRQRTDLGTRTPDYNGNNYTGTGVQITNIERIYDKFIASEVRAYTSQESQQNTFLSYSKQVDDLLGSSELGLDTGLGTFFNAVNEVANDPTSIAARQVLLSQGEVLANRFNVLDQQIINIDRELDNEIESSVNEVNSLIQGIANLNIAIISSNSPSVAQPNDLLDQRDQLINKLSEYVSVSTVENDNGAINVFIGSGQGVVTGSTAVPLSVITDGTTSPPRNSIGFGPSAIDISAQLSGGKIGGALQIRTEVMDAARAELSQLAFSVVDAFNTQNQLGVDLDGNPGGLFFGDLSAVTAGEYASAISVVMTDPRKIAASSTTSPGVGNNENALALANLQTAKTMAAGTQTFADSYGRLVANVATRTHQADVGQKIQQGLLEQTQARQDSVSGVNLDEEAANLIKFQQAYQAASQIITVSNTIFNALINAI